MRTWFIHCVGLALMAACVTASDLELRQDRGPAGLVMDPNSEASLEINLPDFAMNLTTTGDMARSSMPGFAYGCDCFDKLKCDCCLQFFGQVTPPARARNCIELRYNKVLKMAIVINNQEVYAFEIDLNSLPPLCLPFPSWLLPGDINQICYGVYNVSPGKGTFCAFAKFYTPNYQLTMLGNTLVYTISGCFKLGADDPKSLSHDKSLLFKMLADQDVVKMLSSLDG